MDFYKQLEANYQRAVDQPGNPAAQIMPVLELPENQQAIGVLREMVRVVKPGGYIVLETKNRWYGGVMFWIKDFLRRKKGWTMFSSYMDPKKMRLLADEVEGVSLESIGGLILPKGWLVMKYPRLRKLARVAARKHMKFIAAQLVAIYRKDAQ